MYGIPKYQSGQTVRVHLVKSSNLIMMAKEPEEGEAKQFGRRLRQLRIRRGFAKARHLAMALKINENTYYRYERGLNVPSLPMLKLMCETLDVSICDLLPYKGKSHASGSLALLRDTTGVGSLQEDPQQTFEPRVEWSMSSQTRPDPSKSSDCQFLNCSMSAWSLAEIAAELRCPSSGGHAETVRNLAMCASVYLRLKRDPFGTISQLLEELMTVDASAEVWERARQSIEQFTAAYRSYHDTTQRLKSA